jgi:hypothetical protein
MSCTRIRGRPAPVEEDTRVATAEKGRKGSGCIGPETNNQPCVEQLWRSSVLVRWLQIMTSTGISDGRQLQCSTDTIERAGERAVSLDSQKQKSGFEPSLYHARNCSAVSAHPPYHLP